MSSLRSWDSTKYAHLGLLHINKNVHCIDNLHAGSYFGIKNLYQTFVLMPSMLATNGGCRRGNSARHSS